MRIEASKKQLIIAILLLALGIFIGLGQAPPVTPTLPWHPLQQVSDGTPTQNSVDSNNNFIIDQAEVAITNCITVDTATAIMMTSAPPTYPYIANTGQPGTGMVKFRPIINGQNICEDGDGCTYRIISKSTSAGVISSGTYFQFTRSGVGPTSAWRGSGTPSNGLNGDGGVSTIILGPNIAGFSSLVIHDDYFDTQFTAGGLGDTNPDDIMINDLSAIVDFIVSFCD